MSRLLGAIAATRFGMGARAGEIDAAARDPRGWLKAQVRPDAAMMPDDGLPSAMEALEARFSRESAGMNDPDMRSALVKEQRMAAGEAMDRDVEARLHHSATTPDSFADRWMRFWSNHFTVANRDAIMVGLVGPFEREAIRPNVFGPFADLLRAVTFHQGMLVYLDAARSFGPTTAAGRQSGAGLNENLAREILELHTLGVGSGYSQADIIEFAKALTGWTVAGMPVQRLALVSAIGAGAENAPKRRKAIEAAGGAGSAGFFQVLHEPGARTLLGKSYPQAGRNQSIAILDDLARHPATARHVATKLARHFVADQPPASAIGKLEAAFRRSGGDLAEVARAVIDLDEAWGAPQQKFKTPDELLVSVLRAAGRQAPANGSRQLYMSLAQRPFAAPSPAGWPDVADEWAGADAVMKRLEWANVVSRGMARGASPSRVLDWALGDLAGQATRDAVARAESAEQGFTLAIMSPEFQRR